MSHLRRCLFRLSQPPPVAEPMPPYVPSPQVIELNKDFEIALDAAPNVLYGKYKQYGQVRHPSLCCDHEEELTTYSARCPGVVRRVQRTYRRTEGSWVLRQYVCYHSTKRTKSLRGYPQAEARYPNADHSDVFIFPGRSTATLSGRREAVGRLSCYRVPHGPAKRLISLYACARTLRRPTTKAMICI